MADTSANKRIVKNTFMLYIRMFLMMGITLYTSRVILQALGVDDFGIYNIIGGIVVLFSFINSAMVASIQRFLNFELGRGNVEEAQKVFAASLNIYLVIVLVFLVLAETVGLWFLNRYLNVPGGRLSAASWVYQATLVATVLNFIRMPYNAAIIAYERMSFYAYTSVVEAALKLGIVFLLYYFADKLIAYAWLVAIVSLLILLIYMQFCHRAFVICRHHTFAYDRRRYVSLMSFSGWSLFGSVANVGSSQGVNIILNIFFGVVVNAAMGIANQVSSAVNMFVSNFQTAFNPQIIKSYASGEKDRFISLILNSSKYSYYLLFLIALPCYICCEEILLLWLGEVPIHAVSFCRLLILFSLIDALQGPLWVSAQATGQIRNYQLLMSSLILLNLPVTYLVLKIIPVPEMALVVRVCINGVTGMARVIYLNRLYSFPISDYLTKVLCKCFGISVLSGILPIVIFCLTDGYLCLFIVIISSIASSLSFIYLIGLSSVERGQVNSIIRKYICKRGKQQP